ncbi:MAG: hypothetical protein R8G34_00350 [Paracoccaceae bacterium]|nr:hypothetical protein [Paracoccaceae bacterium]
MTPEDQSDAEYVLSGRSETHGWPGPEGPWGICSLHRRASSRFFSDTGTRLRPRIHYILSVLGRVALCHISGSLAVSGPIGLPWWRDTSHTAPKTANFVRRGCIIL